MTWTLVLIFLSSPDPDRLTVVPGFADIALCQRAAAALVAASPKDPWGRARLIPVCVQVTHPAAALPERP